MKDPENEVYTMIAEELRTKFSGISITSMHIDRPSSFPHVSIEMTNNTIITDMIDSGSVENGVECTFVINAYSSVNGGGKSECKKIMETINDLLIENNFIRIAYGPSPNIDDTIYRMTGRYVVETDGTYFYRRR